MKKTLLPLLAVPTWPKAFFQGIFLSRPSLYLQVGSRQKRPMSPKFLQKFTGLTLFLPLITPLLSGKRAAMS